MRVKNFDAAQPRVTNVKTLIGFVSWILDPSCIIQCGPWVHPAPGPGPWIYRGEWGDFRDIPANVKEVTS